MHWGLWRGGRPHPSPTQPFSRARTYTQMSGRDSFLGTSHSPACADAVPRTATPTNAAHRWARPQAIGLVPRPTFLVAWRHFTARSHAAFSSPCEPSVQRAVAPPHALLASWAPQAMPRRRHGDDVAHDSQLANVITCRPTSLHLLAFPGGYEISRLLVHMGHVRSESESVQYVPLDIWTSYTAYKHYKIKVHSLNYGTSVREKINCDIIDKYLRFCVHCDNCLINDTL